MPQNTNLNISPYFDDFSESKKYQRVLFKPGTSVQARELTTLQSILQNQIEKFGQHFFKEGSIVIPGQIAYDSNYTCVQIDDTHLGIPVSFYISSLIGKTIKGETSGVTAKVENYILGTESERENTTLYIKYQSSSETDFSTKTFVDGENLLVLEDISYSLSTIRANTTFATTILTNSTAVGSAAKISSGVYFIRGFFVSVDSQSIILDQYDNLPSYRVGLSIEEEIAVASNDYNDLYDNAQGFSNFSAPGADRLKISTTLTKKGINDFNDENFIELLRVEDGVLKSFVQNPEYNLIEDELARRTYDESGDYYVKAFVINAKESLNNRIGNNGIYYENQQTRQGNIPSADLGSLTISPGKAFVRGYEVETIDTTILDFNKSRTTEKVTNQSIPISIGRQIRLNNVYGSVPVGFGTTSQVSLYDSRTSTPGAPSGSKIGVARIYDLKLKNSEYRNATTVFDCSLYDIQTYTVLTLNSSITQNAPCLVKGKSSNASGYLVSSVSSSNVLTLYQVSGSFRKDEQISINGIDNGRIITRIRDYNLSDVHQLVANTSVSGVGTFTADPILSNVSLLSNTSTQFTISASGGIGTVTCPDKNFTIGISTGDIISYTKQGENVPTYNYVSTVDQVNNILNIKATTNVVGVSSGALPSTTIVSNDLRKVSLEVLNTGSAYLYSTLGNSNISNLDLSTSDLVFKKSYSITVASNTYSGTLETDPNLTLEPFDEEDYTLTYNLTGAVESLTDQKLSVSGRTVTLNNLSQNGSATLTVTFRKINLKVRKKDFVRCSSLVVDKSSLPSSGIGTTTLNDGLTYNQIYGVRVQDKEISLNVPDVVSILGIFESSTINDPSLPKITFSTLNSNVNNLIRGEQLVGQSSNAVAVYVQSNGINEIEIIYLNENRFFLDEEIISSETNITGKVGSISFGDKNIKDNFSLDDGQRPEYYDFSRIIRKKEFSAPTKKIKIVYNSYVLNSSADGDFVGVDSYDKERYTSDIPSISNIRNTDIIDLRPRVSPYNFSSYTKSPFEYESRIFSSLSNSSRDILSKDKILRLSYSYYLSRIDKLFLSKDGIFSINSGVPSLYPKAPDSLDSALEIATIYYPPYVYNIKDIKVLTSSHKRYTMKDISRLEDRLSNVEYYTSLSLLETDTKNLAIKDSVTGLDKFKCGFFVDNFKSYFGGDISNPSFKSSIDTSNGVLRPQHYSTSIDLILGSEAVIGIGTTSNPNVDLRFASDLGNSNVKKVGDVICLNYEDVVYVENKFATRSENVNPFNTPSWIGSIELNPSTDTWIETRSTTRTEDVDGGFSTAMEILGVDSNTGLSPINWNAWETTWTGSSTVDGPILLSVQGPQTTQRVGRNTITTTTTTNTRLVTTTNVGTETRQGIQFGVSERFDLVNLGDRVVSRSVITLMRSRNIEVIARRLKPTTRFYAFFDNVDVTSFIVPKLLEVNMVSGVFQYGETIIGTIPVSGTSNTRSITFRLAKQNHKYGPYDNPTEVYAINPYDPTNSLSSNYSSTTKILNVDTVSLELQSVSEFFGSVAPTMVLVGQTSNAVAEVSDIRLITDNSGAFIGSLFIPDPTLPSNPSFETGTKTFVLTTSSTNSIVSGSSESNAETNFSASGTLDNVENFTLRIRNADVERIPQEESRQVTETTSNIISQTVTNVTTTTRGRNRRNRRARWVDPLAQSFEVIDRNGVFLTKCDIFFRTKDPNGIPVTLQVRTLENGYPTQWILPFSEVILDPKDVSVSEDSTIPTTFTFPSPVYLETGQSYSIVLISDSNEYNVWISRMTEVDVASLSKQESERTIVSQQPLLGSLFKSQNGATWEPSQLEDLKFKLYRANFTSSTGSVRFYNPELNIGNRQISSLRINPISSYSNRILVGIGKSLTSVEVSNLTPGTTIYQNNYNNFSGKLESVVGAIGIGSTLSVTNVGSGYTATQIFPNVPLTTLSGRGFGAKVDLCVSSGVAVAATVSIGGTGYAIGDTLTVSSEYTNNFGKNLILSIPNNPGIISSFNSLIINNVQDQVNTSGISNEIIYVGTSGTTLISGATVKYSETLSDGLHFKVSHNNHGMYSTSDIVELFQIDSDVPPEKLLADYSISATSDIQVSSVGIFTSFENIQVNSNNPGFIKIGNEVIKYTGYNVSSNTLTGIVRSNIYNNTNVNSFGSHLAGSPVFKYEFNGVSLRRINKSHNLSDTDFTTYPTEIDSYHIKVDMSSTGGNVDRTAGNGNNYPILHFNSNVSGGSYNIESPSTNSILGPKATQNIPFNIIRPNVQTLLPESTNVETTIRTFTGTSVDGSEESYIDRGFEKIALNSNNVLSSTRIIASKVNEVNQLSLYPGNKSFTMELSLFTRDSSVSPMIDLDRVNIITSFNRINNPIADFSADPRVNSIFDDPNAAIYISKVVVLEKTADSLKVLFDAYRDQTNEIIALYRILRNDTPNDQQLWELFPGYENLDSNGNVIDPKNNNGKPDRYVNPSPSQNEINSYEYSAKNLPLFNGYQIKLIMTGTNNSYVPQIRDFRAIASI